MRAFRAILPLCALALACGVTARSSIAERPAGTLPAGAERAYTALVSRFDRNAAMDVVAFMQQSWRLAGNPGFNASLDHIHQRLQRAGITARFEEYPPSSPGWDYSRGSVFLENSADAVLSKEHDRVSLAIHSFSTPPGGLTTRLVDVGRSTAADFEGKDVRGAVVLGDAPLGALWREAVKNRGAAGVISTDIARYVRPSPPEALTEEQRDVLQWGSLPHDEKARAFGFKASWRAASRLRNALKNNPAARVRVEIQSSFYRSPARSLLAEIPGRTRPEERIVLVAHVQEPGANDNASGCATLVALAAALNDAIADGALPQPDRTITFMWLDEIRGSRQWITAHPAEARGVRYMFSLDMTGEDTSRTGGTFLIEKQADPSAVWPRPSDPHSEWGATAVKPESLKGSLLNDVHIAVAARRSRDTGWMVRTNPYEGGSDHTVFAASGVPSLLNWHFTDRYYHSNQDTIDKVSAREMEHVGLTVATSSYFLAAATPDDARATLDLLESAATARLQLERRQGVTIVANATDGVAAERTEAEVLAAWIKWYREAYDSVRTLSAAGATSELERRIARARDRLR